MARKIGSALMLVLLFGSMLFPMIMLTGGREQHDIVVMLTKLDFLYNHLESNHTKDLTTYVFNNGSLTENNVTLQLLINDSQAVNTWIGELGQGRAYTSNYQWTPPDGDYNVTAYVLPLVNEIYTANNNDSRFFRVCKNSLPQANFTVSPMAAQNVVRTYANLTFNASNSSNLDWASISGYKWNFTEGTLEYPSVVNANSSSTNHKFETQGTFNVTLTVGDTDGMSSSTSTTLTVSDNPIASFSIWKPSSCKHPLNQEPYYVNKTLTFNASGSSAALGGHIKSYLWSFGDGNSTPTDDPIITYSYNSPSNPKYNVSLTVTDYKNLNDSLIQSIAVVAGKPMANFTVSPVSCYVNRTITFNATSSFDPDNYYERHSGIAGYLWSFGDGNSTPTDDPIVTHVYNSSDNYNVSLVVNDSDEGLKGSVNWTVNVSLEVFVRAVDSATGSTTIIHNPMETFNVSITVTNVENLRSFFFNLSWPDSWMPFGADLFDPDSVAVAYGSFLGPIQNTTTGKRRVEWSYDLRAYNGYVSVSATLSGDETWNGSGTLATITFKVLTSGNCTLRLSDTELLSKSLVPIDSTVENGTFYTSCPVAYFTYLPDNAKYQNVAFDASDSYSPAPNRGIANYTWDFGDKSSMYRTSNPVTTHQYSNGNYDVNLTVTDYYGEKWFYHTSIVITDIHDVAVVNVTLTSADLSDSSLNHTISMVNITVNLKNKGNVEETFNVTVHGDNYTTNTIPVTLAAHNQTQIIARAWNVTGLPKGNYTIYANAALSDDTNQSDNTANKSISLGVPYDLDGNGHVGLTDMIVLINAWGSKPGDPKWNPVADISGRARANNPPGAVVGIHDLVILIKYWGSDP